MFDDLFVIPALAGQKSFKNFVKKHGLGSYQYNQS